jgi:hypothetical protein
MRVLQQQIDPHVQPLIQFTIGVRMHRAAFGDMAVNLFRLASIKPWTCAIKFASAA